MAIDKLASMITILDYGVGNLRSVELAFNHLGYSPRITADPGLISQADFLVVPGQGAFAEAIKNLNQLGLTDIIKSHITSNKPYLGICLGFQILFESSEENGAHQGLRIFKGSVKKFTKPGLKVPHMGWNEIALKNDPNNVFQDLAMPAHVYFAHSYYVTTPDDAIISTETSYGDSFVSSVQRPNLLGIQFHPEKSGDIGLALLKNFTKQVLS
ncbi:MAG: glutamine amidotransferase [Candidatus Marinamargulisbacteria bacterium]|jgi:glutamine amidotransferase